MEAADEAAFTQNEPDPKHFPLRHSDVHELLDEFEATARDFHRDRDLYLLQQRCQSLSLRLDEREPSKSVLEWIATQAELIDCGLIGAPRNSLDEALEQLISSIRAP